MTNLDIDHAVQNAFHALYPHAMIAVTGCGSETINVGVKIRDTPALRFECEIPSDDDGYFHFHLDDADLIILVAYPEA